MNHSINRPAKKDLDWENLSFNYNASDFRFQAFFRDGNWQAGTLTRDENLVIHESSSAIHYAQQCFEGMKAYTAKDGDVLLFRPELNFERMRATAQRLMIPELPKELFFQGVEEVVRQNYAYIPPFGAGASLYIRPLLIGIGKNLGVRPAPEFMFRVFVSPVGPYYKSGKIQPITLFISDFDRAAPKGIGNIKAGANYAPGLFHQIRAKQMGADEIMFLDPLQHKFMEEAGTTNLLVLTKDRKLLSPKAETILPSITRRSLMHIGKELLQLETEERPIDFYQEVDNFQEVAICGTAAVLTPVGKIIDSQARSFTFFDQGKTAGPVMTELYQKLVGIQTGRSDDPFGWNYKVKI